MIHGDRGNWQIIKLKTTLNGKVEMPRVAIYKSVPETEKFWGVIVKKQVAYSSARACFS